MYSTFQDYACITDSADRGRVASLEIRFVQIKAATKNVTALMHDIARQEGVPYGTLRRLYYAWRDGGAIAVADKRKLAKATPFSEVLAVYKTYCEQNKESNKGAWNAMIRDLRCGKRRGDRAVALRLPAQKSVIFPSFIWGSTYSIHPYPPYILQERGNYYDSTRHSVESVLREFCIGHRINHA